MPNNDDDVLRGFLALFSLFLVDILSRSQFLPTPSHPVARITYTVLVETLNHAQSINHPTLTISMQSWTKYETHIFKKWGVPPDLPP